MSKNTFFAALRLAAAALVFALPQAATSAVIYEHTWNPGAADAGAFSQASQRLAAEFVLGANAQVNRATWYGTMLAADPLNTGDTWNFGLFFYNDAAGLPGSTYASAAVLASVTDTGINVQGERAYLFDATFSDIALAAGTTYWLGVQNTGTQNTFRWTESLNGLDSAISFGGGAWAPWSESNRTPLNFALHSEAQVPAPATMAILAIGLLCLGWSLRRKA